MTDGVSSARPARLTRFGDTSAAIDEGLRTRFGILDEALAEYRATCEPAYRLSPTAGTTDVLRAWSETGIHDLGQWVREVGAAFIRSQVVDAYMDGRGLTDPEDVNILPNEDVVGNMDDEYQDDPFLGVPAGGWQIDPGDVSAEDPDAFADLLEQLGLPTAISAEALKGFNDLLDDLPPTAVTVTLRFTSSHVLFMADGKVLARVTRAEATARFLFPGHAPSSLIRTGRFLGRLGGALDFATGAYTQWQEDAGMSLADRLLRSGTKGAGLLGGGIGGGALGGFLGGAAAGTVCGPGAPVCSTALAVGGAIGGGILGSAVGGWLADQLPWMDDDEPLPGEYDLDVIEDEIAQSDSVLSHDFAPVDAATTLVAGELAMAETAQHPDVAAELPSFLPDVEALQLVIEGRPPPREELAPPTGTTVPSEPPQPSPGPAPTPFPEETPTGTTVPGR